MNDRREIKLYLVPLGKDHVSAEWVVGQSPRAKFIFRVEEVNVKATNLRDCALQWAAQYEDDEKTAPVCWDEMQRLGIMCFLSIFKDRVDSIIDSLNEPARNTTIIIKNWITSLSVPWGLLCNPVEIPEETAHAPITCSRPFWGNKYSIVVDYNQYGLCDKPENTNWFFVPVVDKNEFTTEKDLLSGAEQSFANLICEKSINLREIGLKVQRAQCFDKKHHFLYVYGHRSGGGIEFKNGVGEKNIAYFHDMLNENTAEDGQVVFFLNACSSVHPIGSMGQNLHIRNCGKEVIFITTEIPVNKTFAMRFGLELIDRCLQRGESILEAMETMQMNHFPLSLTYAMYGTRDLTVTPPQQLLGGKMIGHYREAIKNMNYSDFKKLLSPS